MGEHQASTPTPAFVSWSSVHSCKIHGNERVCCIVNIHGITTSGSSKLVKKKKKRKRSCEKFKGEKQGYRKEAVEFMKDTRVKLNCV